MRSVTKQREGLGELEESTYVSRLKRFLPSPAGGFSCAESDETACLGQEIRLGARRGGGAMLQ